MSRQEEIEKLIDNYKRRLQKLKEQQALEGSDTSPKILLEIADIEAKIKSLQAELEAIEHPPPPPHFSSFTYNFENRQEDIKKIIAHLEAQPYLHLYAPSGIGKTYLAHQLQHIHYQHHQCAYIDFNNPTSNLRTQPIDKILAEIHRQLYHPSSPIKLNQDDLIIELAQNAKTQPHYSLVVFDNIDKMLFRAIRHLRHQILPKLEEEIDNPTRYLRIIAIAQDELDELNGTGEIIFYPYLLAEFKTLQYESKTYKSLLAQAISKHTHQSINPQDGSTDRSLKKWSQDLYHLTGGHPGAITAILNYIGEETRFAHSKVFAEQHQNVCQNVLAPLLESQVQSCFPRLPDYQEAFQYLWVFRYLSKGIFKQLLNTVKDKEHWHHLNAITHPDDYNPSSMPLWKRLTETPLLQYKQVGRLLSHQLTPIWRKLGNLVLQTTNPALYCTLHHDAYQIFEHFAFRNPSYEIGMRIDCFIEALYHLSQQHTSPNNLLSDQERHNFTQTVLQHLTNFLPTAKSGKLSEEAIYLLHSSLSKDTHLKIELNTIGMADTWQQLLEQIKMYKPLTEVT